MKKYKVIQLLMLIAIIIIVEIVWSSIEGIQFFLSIHRYQESFQAPFLSHFKKYLMQFDGVIKSYDQNRIMALFMQIVAYFCTAIGGALVGLSVTKLTILHAKSLRSFSGKHFLLFLFGLALSSFAIFILFPPVQSITSASWVVSTHSMDKNGTFMIDVQNIKRSYVDRVLSYLIDLRLLILTFMGQFGGAYLISKSFARKNCGEQNSEYIIDSKNLKLIVTGIFCVFLPVIIWHYSRVSVGIIPE